jgi:hypothetical protein
MQPKSDPQIVFSAWVRWSECTTLGGIRFPGVYLLAHFRNCPSGAADPRAKQIIYIGETCRNLIGRWRQFNRSAFRGKRGHSGGRAYRKVFGCGSGRLWVAAFPVIELNEELRPSFIRFAERKLIWEYAMKWGAPPRCNRK